MGTPTLGRAVLELRTDSATFLSDLAKAKQSGKDLGTTFEDSGRQIGRTFQGAGSQVEQFSGVLAPVQRTLGAFGIALSLEGAIQGIRRLIEYAESVHDIALATGMSMRAVQEYAAGGQRVGLDMKGMAESVVQLSRRIADGGGAIDAALAGLGLDAKQLRAEKPETVFEDVAEAVRKIDDPLLQDRIAFDLFGRSFQQVLAFVKSGVPEARRWADQMHLVASDQDITRVHEWGQQFTTVIGQLEVAATSALADLFALAHFPETVHPGAAPSPGALGTPIGAGAGTLVTGLDPGQIHAQVQALTDLNAKIHLNVDATRAATTAGGEHLTQSQYLQRQLQYYRTQAVEPLTAQERAYVQVAHAAHATDQQMASDLRVSLGAVSNYVKVLDDAAAAAKRRAENQKEITAAQKPLTEAQLAQLAVDEKLHLSDEQIAQDIGAEVSQVRLQIATEKEEQQTLVARAATAKKVQEEELKRYVEAGKARNTAAEEALKATADAEQERIKLETDYDDLVDQRTLPALDSQIAAIQRQHDTEQLRLRDLGTSQQRALNLLLLEGKTYEEIAAATKNYYHSIGVYTQSELDQAARDAKAAFDAVLADGNHSAEGLAAAFKNWYDADQARRRSWVQGFFSDLDGLASRFQQLVQIAGADSGVGHVAQELGTLVSSASMAYQAGHELDVTMVQLDHHAISSGQAVAQFASSLVQAVAAMDQATSSGSRLQNTVGGATTGASIGSAGGGWGALVGAIIGGVYGALSPTAADVNEQALAAAQTARNTQYAALAQQIRQLLSLGGFGYAAGGGIEQFIASWGPGGAAQATIAGVAGLTQALADLQAQYQTLQQLLTTYQIDWTMLTPARAQEEANTAGDALATQALALQSYGVTQQNVVRQMSTALNAYIAQAMQAGTQLPESLQPYISEMVQLGLITDANRRALLGLGPSWQTMQQVAQAIGIDVTSPYMGAAYGQGQVSDLAQQITSAWQQLSAGGAQFGIMRTPLTNLVEQALRSGAALPSEMKWMIDQIVGWGGQLTDEAGNILDVSQLHFADLQSATEQQTSQLLTAFDALYAHVDPIASAIGTLPNDIAAAFARLYPPPNYSTPYLPWVPGGPRTPPEPGTAVPQPGEPGYQPGLIPGYHQGGIVKDGTYWAGGAMLAREFQYAPRLHSGGEVPAWLLPREGVLNHLGMAALGGPAALAAYNRGEVPTSHAGENIRLEIPVQIGSKVVTDVVIDNLWERLAERGRRRRG